MTTAAAHDFFHHVDGVRCEEQDVAPGTTLSGVSTSTRHRIRALAVGTSRRREAPRNDDAAALGEHPHEPGVPTGSAISGLALWREPRAGRGRRERRRIPNLGAGQDDHAAVGRDERDVHRCRRRWIDENPSTDRQITAADDRQIDLQGQRQRLIDGGLRVVEEPASGLRIER
jgi:hypothetical protein